jgi:hypothetical protein
MTCLRAHDGLWFLVVFGIQWFQRSKLLSGNRGPKNWAAMGFKELSRNGVQMIGQKQGPNNWTATVVETIEQEGEKKFWRWPRCKKKQDGQRQHSWCPRRHWQRLHGAKQSGKLSVEALEQGGFKEQPKAGVHLVDSWVGGSAGRGHKEQNKIGVVGKSWGASVNLSCVLRQNFPTTNNGLAPWPRPFTPPRPLRLTKLCLSLQLFDWISKRTELCLHILTCSNLLSQIKQPEKSSASFSGSWNQSL